MTEYNVWGQPIGGKKRKKESNPFGGGLDFGIKPQKNQKNPFDVGIGLGQKPEKTKYERVPVTSEQKKAVLFRQKDKCAWPNCRVHFHRDGVPPHFDHIKRVDKGGKSLTSNLQALCPNHHQLKTHKENLKEVEKTRQKAKKKEDNGGLFGGSLFGPPPKRSKNNPFGL